MLLHNSLMERTTPQASQQQFILLFSIWSIITGAVLLIMSLTENVRSALRGKETRTALMGRLSIAAALLFFRSRLAAT